MRIMKWLSVFLLVVLLAACSPTKEAQPENEYERFRGNFFDTFDTVVQVVGYTETEQEFQSYMKQRS